METGSFPERDIARSSGINQSHDLKKRIRSDYDDTTAFLSKMEETMNYSNKAMQIRLLHNLMNSLFGKLSAFLKTVRIPSRLTHPIWG
ncbi:hypothetical protein [Nitrosomonas cryotolerans]|uniref:hypothetical protein n=1 Tax=Nitrosomonas cryotolerans TaxID=44575 RepID=UPI00048ED1E4|nr:hypothetical protein [Nitrosomonas cryotolerans]